MEMSWRSWEVQEPRAWARAPRARQRRREFLIYSRKRDERVRAMGAIVCHGAERGEEADGRGGVRSVVDFAEKGWAPRLWMRRQLREPMRSVPVMKREALRIGVGSRTTAFLRES